mmetsp:Transcript_5244/g.13571  ORF Transcript_5244/g.13571 Transcript_5244/m.13571 type:complete len:219 (-) Transcript_5244:86-742(-)
MLSSDVRRPAFVAIGLMIMGSSIPHSAPACGADLGRVLLRRINNRKAIMNSAKTKMTIAAMAPAVRVGSAGSVPSHLACGLSRQQVWLPSSKNTVKFEMFRHGGTPAHPAERLPSTYKGLSPNSTCCRDAMRVNMPLSTTVMLFVKRYSSERLFMPSKLPLVTALRSLPNKYRFSMDVRPESRKAPFGTTVTLFPPTNKSLTDESPLIAAKGRSLSLL